MPYAYLVWPLGHGVVGGLADEAQGALTANHQAFDDLNGIIHGEVHLEGGKLGSRFKIFSTRETAGSI